MADKELNESVVDESVVNTQQASAEAPQDVVAEDTQVEPIIADEAPVEPPSAPFEEESVKGDGAYASDVYLRSQEQLVDNSSPEQIQALEEQGAFDYHIEGANAVLNSPYTPGSFENVHYTNGWNKAFDGESVSSETAA